MHHAVKFGVELCFSERSEWVVGKWIEKGGILRPAL